LFYRAGNRLVAVEVTTEPSFATGARKHLFATGAYLPNLNHAMYDVMPGDSAFVFIRGLGETQEVVMVLNWFPELKQRTER
jgi:hypothetical protein